MKMVFVALTVATLVGCNQGTPGGPGATAANGENPTTGQADDTFNLSVPMTSSSLQQGDQSEVTVGIDRAKNFDQDVTLKFSDVPEGVTIGPVSPVIKSSDTDVKLTLTAGDGTPTGDFKFSITGHPTKGADAQIEFKLTVAPKDSFTLSMPLLPTSLKQGESKTVSIGINRDKKFDQDVAMNFDDMPTGVTLTPPAPVIKRGDTETKITLTAANDASLGDFAVKLLGHPGEGLDKSSEFKFTVIKLDKE
ncbi:MAG: hypothetical protein HQ518_20290 [Rhodopirellula sp.]|nr:hypothetical protein [Rhodopirellula sp.]